MRKIIKKILEWILHEHCWELNYRLITYCEVLKRNNWVKDVWVKMEWHRTCKICGKKDIKRFYSKLPYPKKPK